MDAAVFGIVGAIGQGLPTHERRNVLFTHHKFVEVSTPLMVWLRQHISPMIGSIASDGLGEFGVIGEEPCWAET